MMLRFVRIALGLALLIASSSANVQAQFGYGYGWGGGGGWSSTLQGDVARGMGYYYTGAGIYNKQTAEARSINADTYMRLNEYFYEAHLEATRNYWAKKNTDAAKTKGAYDAIQARLQNNPSSLDIENGSALNRALDQLTDPRLGRSTLRMATTEIDASMIREIPFRNNTDAVTFVLSKVKAATKWPAALNDPRFADEKKTFEEVVDQARKEDEQGDIAPETLERAHSLVASLRSELQKMPLADAGENAVALKFVKTLAGLIRLLDNPDTKAAIDQLRDVKTTSLGNLLGFMHSFNLRFGPAETPRQKAVYNQLWPALDETRDRVMADTKMDTSTTARANDTTHVGEVFDKLSLDEIDGRAKKAAPAPPKPQE